MHEWGVVFYIRQLCRSQQCSAATGRATTTAMGYVNVAALGYSLNCAFFDLIRVADRFLAYSAYYAPCSTVDIRLRVSGGGHTSQIYAIRQAIAKSLVAYYAKYYDAASALELRQLFVAYDRSLLIADTRRSEPKKFGGRGARARRQKSYR